MKAGKPAVRTGDSHRHPGFLRLAAACALLSTALLCLGWGGTWKEIREGVEGIRSVRADFIQEKHMKILARPLVSKGVFYFRTDGALRWEYTEPVRSILLMADGGVRRFIEGKAGLVEEDTARLQSMRVVMGEISRWLRGRFNENPDFEAVLSAGGEIVLTPRQPSMGRIIDRIVLQLSETPGVMESVSIYEGADSYTRLTFRETVLNPDLDDALFRKVR